MSHDPLKFWITCPNCKHPFGVEPRAILQYLNRVLDARMDERAEPSSRGVSPTLPTERPAPAGKPAPSTPKAPYKPPYRRWKR